jgi:hypothetical protein
MITIIIASLSLIAIVFLLQQLIKSYPNNNIFKALRDLFVIMLALGITVLILFIAFRLLRFIL